MNDIGLRLKSKWADLNTVSAECTSPAVGIDRGNILDSQMQASTGNASLARLNGASAWCPVREGLGEYIQVKSNNIWNAIYDHIFHKVRTQSL